MPLTYTRIKIVFSVILLSTMLVSCKDTTPKPEQITPDSRIPSAPFKLNFDSIRDKIKVSWQAPKVGEAVTYYSISRAINDPSSSNYKLLDNNIAADQFEFTELFPSRIEDDRYYYKVTASNIYGTSQSEIVAPVIRSNLLTITHVEQTRIIPVITEKYFQFDIAFALSPAGDTIAVTNYAHRSQNTNTAPDAFILIYNRNQLGEWSQQPIAGLNNDTNIKFYSYSLGKKSLTFSPDGNTLAIGVADDSSAIRRQSSVKLFSKNNQGVWNSTALTTLFLPTPSNENSYGETVTFSPDGQYLAVSDSTILDGTAYIYSKDITGKWGTTAIAALNVPIATLLYRSSVTLEFSPDSLTLAMGLSKDAVVSYPQAGTVRLFTKSKTGRWDNATTSTLQSMNPGLNREFGTALVFSPDGKSLAITEDNNEVDFAGSRFRTGIVQLFTKNPDNNWNIKPTQVFRSNGKFKSFGTNLAFNPDSTQLAISEISTTTLFENTINEFNGSVLIFSKDNNGVWDTRNSAVLGATKVEILSSFGTAMNFSKKDNTLVVAGINYLSVYDTGNM